MDGKTFSKAQALADSSQGDFFDVKGSAARDTGGFLVYDDNSSGPVRAVPVGPQTLPVGDGPPGGCTSAKLTGAPVIVTTQGSCFTDAGGGKRATTGDVRINGVDVMTGNGEGAPRPLRRRRSSSTRRTARSRAARRSP